MRSEVFYAFITLHCILIISAPVNSQRVDPEKDVTVNGTATSVCFKDGKPKMCVPKFESMAYKVRPEVTSTCGLHGREKYCVQTSIQSSSAEGQYCDYCDQTELGKSHEGDKMTDFNVEKPKDSFWQSQTLASTESKSSDFNVNITIDFGIQSQITYIWLRFQSPRPYSMAFYRKVSYSSDWEPWAYFSRSCMKQYGIPPDQKLVLANRTKPICQSHLSDMVPLTGGNIYHATLLGRMELGKENFWSDTALQNWMLAAKIRVSLDKLNTHGDTYSKDVLNRYFYAITDISVGGRCHCNGHASVCKKDDATMKRSCVCQHNTVGDQCERCREGFEDRPWRRATKQNAWPCKPCNCSGNSELCEFSWELYRASGNVSGGRCLSCQGNTEGPHCERCRPNHRRLFPGSRQCIHCQCHPVGSVTEQCDDDGSCSCRPRVGGTKCDRCQVGSYNLTSAGCTSCNCLAEGTASNAGECDAGTGACSCKPNVRGARCASCRPGHFGLQRDDPDGCQRCFCYGHSARCRLHPGLEQTQLDGLEPLQKNSEDFWLLMRSGATSEKRLAAVPVSPFPDAHVKAELVGLAPPYDSLYFSLPQHMLGNQSLSYNRFLRFELALPRSPVTRRGLSDVELVSGEKVFSTSLDVSRLTNGTNRLAVRLAHDPASSQWHQLADSGQEFRSVLANLTAVRIRASFLSISGKYVYARLSNVSLESAKLSDGTGVKATNVHICDCPEGHTGSFCEKCKPGYTREKPNSGPFGKCVPCRCHGHWDVCDPESGSCGERSGNDSRGATVLPECRDNTVGINCELCAPGYYGNATDSRPGACKRCPCPSGSRCQWDATLQQAVCTSCPPGLAGVRCDACAANFWGVAPDCTPCNCSGNADPNDLQACNRSTGVCTACVDNTGGKMCEICKNGFYGNALAPGRAQCRPCDCDFKGTRLDETCDHRTGECRCKSHVTGRRCDKCQSGYFNISSGQGCQPCGCNFTGTDGRVSCDIESGQCTCQPGVTGRVCDECEPGHFKLSKKGCTPCECNTVGTRGPLPAQCDENGNCPCRESVEGAKCDRCQENRYNLSAGCQECPACYGVVQELVRSIRQQLADIEGLFNESVSLDKSDVRQRLRRANETAEQLLAKLKEAAGPSLDETNLRLLRNLSREIEEAYNRTDRVEQDLRDVVNFVNVTFPEIQANFSSLNASVAAGQVSAKQEMKKAEDLLAQHKNLSANISGANEALQSQLEKVKMTVENIRSSVTRLGSATSEQREEAQRLLNETEATSDRVDGLRTTANSLLEDVERLEEETEKAKRLVENATAEADAFYSLLLEQQSSLSFISPNFTLLSSSLDQLDNLIPEVERNFNEASGPFKTAGDNLQDAMNNTAIKFERQKKTQEDINKFYEELLRNQKALNETLERCREYYDTASKLYKKLTNYETEVKESKAEIDAALNAVDGIRAKLNISDRANDRSEELLKSQEPIVKDASEKLAQTKVLADQLLEKSGVLIDDGSRNLKEVTDAHNQTQELYDSLERLDSRLQEMIDSQGDVETQLKSLSTSSSEAKSNAISLQTKVDELSKNIERLGKESSSDSEFDAEVKKLNETIKSMKGLGGGDDEKVDLGSLLGTVDKYLLEQNKIRKELEWLDAERQRLTDVADELQIYTDSKCAFELPGSIT